MRYRSGSGFERGKIARGGSDFRVGASGDVERTWGTAGWYCLGTTRVPRLGMDVPQGDGGGAMVNSARLRPSFAVSRPRSSL
jgi:hypothetical protein